MMSATKWLHPLQLRKNSNITQIICVDFVHSYKVSKFFQKMEKLGP